MTSSLLITDDVSILEKPYSRLYSSKMMSTKDRVMSAKTVQWENDISKLYCAGRTGCTLARYDVSSQKRTVQPGRRSDSLGKADSFSGNRFEWSSIFIHHQGNLSIDLSSSSPSLLLESGSDQGATTTLLVQISPTLNLRTLSSIQCSISFYTVVVDQRFVEAFKGQHL
eukprot:Gb_30598 [translate_table: standard]